MNNKIKILGIALIAVLALAALGAGVAFARTQTPNTGFGPGWMMGGNGQTGYGSGMMGGRGGMMSGYTQNGDDWEWMNSMHQWMTASGGMHTFVWNALAEKLGLTNDELYAEVNSGKTIAQIAEEKGVSRADLVAALETAHQTSLAQAVTDGALTQEQADSILAQMAGRYEWMLDNMGSGGMMSGQYGAGGMMNGQTGAGGCHGNWNDGSTNQQPKP
jgi:DNA-binding phage protein